MKYLKRPLLAFLSLTTCVLIACWQTLLFLVDLIDGGDDEANSFRCNNNIHYNHRTGDIDPVRHLDGLYDNKP